MSQYLSQCVSQYVSQCKPALSNTLLIPFQHPFHPRDSKTDRNMTHYQTHPQTPHSPQASQPTLKPLPLILTLKLDSTSFDRLNVLRQQYFPHDRNFLSAHVTMFHALPGEHELEIRETLKAICAHTAQFPVTFPSLRFLGKGFAAELEAPELVRLHQRLSTGWQSWLTPQDRQKYKPHVTIQNKVAPEIARAEYEQEARGWEPLQGSGEGLLLWSYRGGPWERVEAFEFLGDPSDSSKAATRNDLPGDR